MKGLLQSKHFKKNLKKWVFMYVLCMGVFTTVITYSRYISNMFSSNDSARVSNFNLNLMYCDNEICSKEQAEEPIKYRPFGEMEYYFAIDGSELEVGVDVIFNVTADRHFKIKKVEKLPGGNTNEIKMISKNSNQDKTLSFSDVVTAGEKQIIKYKVILTYDEKVVDYNKESCKAVSDDCKVVNGIVKEDGIPKYIFDDKTVFNAITVGYSATQKK